MGKKSPSPPPAPDPYATAAAQGAQNKEAIETQARVNRVNESTPYGQLKYIKNADGTYTRQQTYNPDTMDLIRSQQEIGSQLGRQALSRASQLPNDTMTFDNLPAYQYKLDQGQVGRLPVPEDFNSMAKRTEKNSYDRAMALMQPQMDLESRRLSTTLANRGLPLNSEAYNTAQDRLGRQQGQQRQDAAFNAVIAGNNERDKLYNMAMQSRGQQMSDALAAMSRNNAARQQMVQDQYTQRMQPFNELSLFLQGAPAVNLPQFQGMSNLSVPNVDIASMINGNYANQMANYNNALNRQSNTWGQIIGAGGQIAGSYLGRL